jgi:hypothetical protein
MGIWLSKLKRRMITAQTDDDRGEESVDSLSPSSGSGSPVGIVILIG